MFYLRLNKLRIYSNDSLLGMSDIQLMSFVTHGEADFPMLKEFFRNSNINVKRELVSQAVARVISSRVIPQIQHVKDDQHIYFGNTGYNIFVSSTIPHNINWMLLAVKSNQQKVDNVDLLTEILTKKNLTNMINSISLAAGATSPVTVAVNTLATLVAESILKLGTPKDKQLGLLLTSFTRQEHYPYGKCDAQNAPDVTGNMEVDYTIFGF
jgi:hypothetical protein